MEERRDQPPDDASARPPLATGIGRLSPLQQAYAAYTEHAIACDACRDIDRTCGTAGTLWRTYQDVADSACRRIARPGQ